MTQTISQRIEELKQHPVFGQYQAWAIEAMATCDIEGHPGYIGGRCTRCRNYEPAKPVTPIITTAPRPERARCPHYTTDQGCPLHGETCAPEYR